MQKNLLSIGILCFVIQSACADANFRDDPKTKRVLPSPVVEEAQAVAEPKVVQVDDKLAADGLDASVIKSFEYGKADPKVDYLFVVDNSVSMLSIVQLVDQGFRNVVETQAFSPDSRIAVMSTMHADPNDFSKTGLGINRYTGIDFEPGFLDFVHKAAVDKYLDEAEDIFYRVRDPIDISVQWAIPTCENRWFKPTDKNDIGFHCLTAALQSTYSALGAEAGILAYEQLILKNAEKPVFREDALVNVIFVSDTHHPGRNIRELIDSTKSYAQLAELTKKSNKIRSLKFHAVAPAAAGEGCEGNDIYGLSYYKLVDASMGTKEDSCSSNNYTNFMKSMIAASEVVDPVFELDEKLSKIEELRVNGEVYRDFELAEDGKSIVVRGLDPKKAVDLTVIFSLKTAI